MAMVCPPNLEMGVFTAEALDKIDNNGSSTTTISFLDNGIALPCLVCVMDDHFILD